MIIQARDNPGSSGISRFDTASVNITVIRNPNAPRFSAGLYNATISEYLEVQQPVVRTIASDIDVGPVSGDSFLKFIFN
ncbi:hypothetical protein DPMN_036501 [Dreissena polymorpha]|uniref:Uncharacterized protein n=1 Tax=Dreissena polymorpha TaxID=45954 RepID=A0A9D4RNX8_DREPO|nr:hypothetical protein DPMN_036501 [Dreissena polymorpha]